MNFFYFKWSVICCTNNKLIKSLEDSRKSVKQEYNE